MLGFLLGNFVFLLILETIALLVVFLSLPIREFRHFGIKNLMELLKGRKLHVRLSADLIKLFTKKAD